MTLDKLKAYLSAFIERRTHRLRYAGLQAAKVVKQNTDYSLELQFEDESFPPLKAVKLLQPFPGCYAKVSAGARAMVGWLGASEEFPVVVAFDSIGTTTQLDFDLDGDFLVPTVGGGFPQQVVRFGDNVVVGTASGPIAPASGPTASRLKA